MRLTPQQVNEWRIVPRIIVVLYGWEFYDMVQWYTGLSDPTTQQTAFVSAMVGAAAAFFGFYTNTGCKNGVD